jgi:hypothetical protein
MLTPRTLPARTLKARIAALCAEAVPHPETHKVDRLSVDLEGMPGSRHHGFWRQAGPREPWYRRGTPIRSGRQVTLVSIEELAAVATLLHLPELEAEWIGGNVVVEGLPNLSWLPMGTRIFAASGAVLVVEGQNAPCRIAGRAIARHVPDDQRPGLDTAFAKLAAGQRGLVASVERAGDLATGDTLTIKIAKQWIYEPTSGDQGQLF